MENPEGNIVYIKINLSCCDDCPKELEEVLKEMKGVSSVIVDQENNMAMVVTNIDPTTMVEMIKKKGKTAKIFNPFDQNVGNDESTRHSKTSSNNGSSSNDQRTDRFRCKTSKMMHHDCKSKETSEHDYSSSSSNSSSRSRGYNVTSDNHKMTGVLERKHLHHGKKIKEEEHVCESAEFPIQLDSIGKKKDDHVCETYEKAAINPLICKDLYCKLHAQRGIISSKVPSIDSKDHPRHTNGFLNNGLMKGNSLFEQNVPVEYFPQRMPPLPSYGSYPASIMPGNHDYTYSGKAVPLPGYDYYEQAYSRQVIPLPEYDHYEQAYSRQAIPLSEYDQRISYPAARSMPEYDEHIFSGNNMPFHGSGNRYR